jgi:hypothetical protein
MAFESISVVREEKGIKMMFGVYSASIHPTASDYTTINNQFQNIRYAFDYVSPNRWNTGSLSSLPQSYNPLKNLTQTDAGGNVIDISNNPTKAFDGTPRTHYDNRGLARTNVTYYEEMGKYCASNNMKAVTYPSDGGKGGFKTIWLSNFSRDYNITNNMAKEIYKVQISTCINALELASPGTYQRFHIINEIFHHNRNFQRKGHGQKGGPFTLMNPYPFLKNFGASENLDRNSIYTVNNLERAQSNIAKYLFQTAYDNLPLSLKNKKCLFTGDTNIQPDRELIDRYKSISDSLTNGARIHGLGYQIHMFKNSEINQMQLNFADARKKGFDIIVMEFYAPMSIGINGLKKIIRICLNQGVKSFNINHLYWNKERSDAKQFWFFSGNGRPTEWYNAVLDEYKNYNPLKEGSGEWVS